LIRRALERGDVHGVAAVNVGGSGKTTAVSSVSVTGGGQMDEKDERSEELTDDELEKQEGEELPERTQMTVIPVHGLPGATLPVMPPEYE